VSETAARVVLGCVCVALLAGAAAARLPQFWADGATYHAMAWSLAEDGNLEYEPRDIFRVRRELPSGPQGLFLKRASGGLTFDRSAGFPWLRRVPAGQPRIYYAKALLYPLAAAPMVKLFGTRGLLLTNALSLGAALALAYALLRRDRPPLRALVLALVLMLGTVAPLYVIWPQPEIFTLALVTAGLVAWRWGWPLTAAVLLGLATYAKPYNLFLALPLGVEPLLGEGTWGRRLLESVRRGAVMAGTTVALFGLNALVTGEVNYQGGERKTFYGTFPFEAHGVTFGNSGQWMTTDHLGPLVEGEDDAKVTRRTGPARPPGEIGASFVRNLAYFWVGRFGGAVAYFAPVILAVLAFLLLGPRTRAGGLAFAALIASWLFYIWQIPDNWYGGGGTVGNRYFLNLAPLALFMAPRGREWLVALPGFALSVLWLSPVWAAPITHSLASGRHATRATFAPLPPELTMLNDLSVFTEGWRKKRPFGDTEGDPHKHWPADPKAYYLYFLGQGTSGKDIRAGVEGFWLRADGDADLVVRALEPVRRLTVRFDALRGGEAAVTAGADRASTPLAPGVAAAVVLEPGPGFPYYDSFVYRLRIRARASGPAAAVPEPPDGPWAAFVSIALEVDRRPRPGGAAGR
jgi:hypothetical protein